MGFFYADMACAIIASLTLLAIPLSIRHITKNLETHSPVALNQIYMMGGIMLGLVAVHAICHVFVDYKGHIMAAKKANAHDFIMSLPNRYATDIGQRGVKLSGGQKQRLSIARVFLKNPPIIIFDEATSSLDNEIKKTVQDALEKLIENHTTIVIAHRLSTIKNAKRILVLTDNGIEEQGHIRNCSG